MPRCWRVRYREPGAAEGRTTGGRALTYSQARATAQLYRDEGRAAELRQVGGDLAELLPKKRPPAAAAAPARRRQLDLFRGDT